MKHIIKLFILLLAVFQINNLIAAESIIGNWQGNLVTDPGSEIAIQFIISQDTKGVYSAILNSPDQGAIKDVKANSVTFTAGVLKLEVRELNGSYEGTLKNGRIDGKWKQEGTTYPLILSPFTKHTITQTDIDEAVAVAEKFIGLMDTDKFSEAYALGDKQIKTAMTEKQWNDSLSPVKKSLGKMKTRNKLSARYTDEMRGVKGGDHVEISYETTFENEKTSLLETAIMTYENSAWKVSGYFYTPMEMYKQMQTKQAEQEKKAKEAEKK